MDFFGGIGNWFRGAFNNDEEKKRKKPPVQPRPAQPRTLVKPPTLVEPKRPVVTVEPVKPKPQPVVSAPRIFSTPTPQYKGYDLDGMTDDDKKTAAQLIDRGRDANKFIAAAKNAGNLKRRSDYENSVTGKIVGTVGEIPKQIFIESPKKAVETLQNLQRTEQTFGADKLRANEALLKSNLREIERAQKAGEITPQKANDLRNKYVGFSERAKADIAKNTPAYEKKYGKAPAKGDVGELFDVATGLADALGVGFGAGKIAGNVPTIRKAAGRVAETAADVPEQLSNMFRMLKNPELDDVLDAEILSDRAVTSLKNNPENRLNKPDRLDGEKYSIQEARTGLTQTGKDMDGRIVFGKNDKGEIIIKDGTHLLEAYREEGLPVPTRKLAFQDGLTVDDLTKPIPDRRRPGATTPKPAEDNIVVSDKLTPTPEKTPERVELHPTSREALEEVANDPNLPAFRRKRAQDILDRDAKATADRLAAQADEAFRSAPENVPSYLFRRQLDNVVRQEEDNLNTYLNENPGLTQAQIDAARQAAADRVIKLTDEMKANRDAALRATGAQADELADDAAARVATNEEVAAAQAADTAPVSGDTTPTGNAPELDANDAAYRSNRDEIIYGSDKFEGRDGLNIFQTLNPNRLIRENVTRPIEGGVNRVVGAAQTAENPLARNIGRFFTGFNRETGVDAATQTARMQLRGGVEKGKLDRDTVADLSKGFKDDSKTRIWATLDPEFAQRAGIEVTELTPEEQIVQTKLKAIIDDTTKENLRRGLITPEQAANESYLKRSYSIYDGNEDAVNKFEKGFRQELLGQFKGRKEVSDEMVELAIKDPTYLVGKKTAESQAIWAMQDYGSFLSKQGHVIDTARPGYVKLPDSPVFGEAAGKYIPQNLAEDFSGFQYTNAMVSAFNDFVTAYDRLKIRQAKKSILTVFNPAVRLGNQFSNRVIFSTLNGINPVQFNAAYYAAGNAMKTNAPLYREAVEQGLTGIDVTQADFYAQRIARAGADPNIAKRFADHVKKSYSKADDQSRVASYMVRRRQGYSPEEAARLTQRGYQDYKSVGFFYDLAAKTPLVGNAFVRFAADSVRIAKNTAVDHPLSAIGAVATWTAITKGMSVMSGESEEQKQNREDRFGAPKIPFTDISLAVQTPFGEVNVARFMPWYALNDIESMGIARFLPFSASPVGMEDGKATVNPGAFNDPLLGQFAQLLMDKDFRGKSIADPKNNAEGDKYLYDQQHPSDGIFNRLRFLFTNNAPLGKEIDALASAATGNEDIYGKERSFPQALARAMGFKVEQQGEEQATKRASMEAYFAEQEQIDKELEGMTPAAQEAWKRLTGYHKLREQVENEFEPGKTRDKKAPVYDFSEDKWKDFAAHPELYKLMVDKKQRQFAADGRPVQPEFDPRISEGFRRQLLQNKMVAPGDDAELDQRMYSSPEWDYFQSLKDQYEIDTKKYYGESDGEFKGDELVKNQDDKFPTKPDLLKAYSAAYGQYVDGKRDKPEFTDEMKQLKAEYNLQTFNWTNDARRKRGLPPIVWDMWNNPTFGYDEKASSGSGFGFGRGGGGGGENSVNLLGELSRFSSDVSRLAPMEAQSMPDIARMLATLRAGSGGGRQKPRLGASSRGQ